MRFRHAFSILSDNFIDTLKLLLYRLVTTVIFGSISYVILKLGLEALTSSAEAAQLKELIQTFFNGLLSGTGGIPETFQSDFHRAIADLVTLIVNHSASLIGCVAGLCVIYLLSRFVNGLAVFSLGGVVNDRMSTYAHTKFSRSYFKNLGKASLYQVIYVPVCFLYDALMLLGCWFFFFYAPSFLPWSGFLSTFAAISLTVLAIVLLEALKMTLISAWMPRIIAGEERVTKAFRASVASGKDFGGRFVGFVMAIFSVVVVNAAAAVFTVGSALLVTVPASYIFLLCMQFVNYYRDGGRRYFSSRGHIEGESAGGADLPA